MPKKKPVKRAKKILHNTLGPIDVKLEGKQKTMHGELTALFVFSVMLICIYLTNHH